LICCSQDPIILKNIIKRFLAIFWRLAHKSNILTLLLVTAQNLFTSVLHGHVHDETGQPQRQWSDNRQLNNNNDNNNKTLFCKALRSPPEIAYKGAGSGRSGLVPVRDRFLNVAYKREDFGVVERQRQARSYSLGLLVADISSRSKLRSAQRGDVVVPRTRTQLGRRSFHVAAPVVWNALPAYLRSTSISRGQFRAGLNLT